MIPDSQPVFMLLGSDLGVILLVVREERPHHPSILVRQRDGRPVLPPSGDEGSEPSTPLVIFDFDPTEGGSRTVNQQLTPIAIPVFADPEEPWLTPCGVFPRGQSQPTGGRS
jgi:hypothetical protein